MTEYAQIAVNGCIGDTVSGSAPAPVFLGQGLGNPQSGNVRKKQQQRARPFDVIPEQIFDSIPQDQILEGSLAFEVNVREPGEGATCAVRVHLDVDRDGVVSVGDYVSTEHIPVLQDADSSLVRVRVSRVG